MGQHGPYDDDSGSSPPGAASTDQDELSLYRLLVLSVKDYAIFALDATGHVITWNEGARRLKGYEASEIIGRHFSTFYPPEDIAWGKPAYELDVAREIGRFEDEGWRLRKDGTRFWANVVITTLYDDANQVIGFAKVTRDLTERRQAEERRLADGRRLAAEEASRLAAETHATELSRLNRELADTTRQLQEQTAALEQQHADSEAVKGDLQHANSQLRLSMEEAHAARLEAESANEAKSTFLAIMSHELRTPINAIIGYTELIAEQIVGPLNDIQRSQLDRVRTSAGHLLSLIENVLTLSRVEAGKETVRIELVDANSLVRDSAALVEPSAASKGLEFSTRTLDAAYAIATDSTKVRQILTNLLSNSVKFTEHGRISLELRLTGSDVEFRVSDTGVGIAANLLSRVFEPFWQASQSHATRRPGVGLGLSVAQHLAGLLGGAISVESEVGVGSTFILRLPGSTGTDDAGIAPTPPVEGITGRTGHHKITRP
jgi:PAS domain S-box-containing protein